MKNIFVVMEGVDGAGKTTTGRIIAEKIGATFYQTPDSFWRKYRSLVENKPAFIRFLYYLAATMYSSCVLKRMLKKTSVVCDRYIHSTFCHHKVYGVTWLKMSYIKYLPIQKPNVIFYLHVDPAERKRRITQRAFNTDKDRDCHTQIKTHNLYMSIADIHKIDCTAMTPDEVANVILSEINKHLE